MKTCKKGLHQYEGKQCPTCKMAAQKKWQAANDYRYKDARLAWRKANKTRLALTSRRHYGNVPGYPSPGFCESCDVPIVSGRKGSNAARSDHDHDTGVWRGWLCHKCNLLEGKIRKVDSNDQDVQNVRAYLARKKAKSAA